MAEENPFRISVTKRAVSAGAEKELFYNHRIGESGEVELVDYMGNDDTVEYAATLGFGRNIFPEKPSQREFINYLVKNKIETPFKSVQIKYSMQSPIEVAFGPVYEPDGNKNEYSGRYSVMLGTYYSPSLEKLVLALGENDGLKAKSVLEKLSELRKSSFSNYEKLVSSEIDMARELSRGILGTNNDTRYYWKIDLFSLSRFIKKYNVLLLKWDIARDFLEEVSSIAHKVAPISWEVLMEEDDTSLKLTMPRDKEIVDPDLSPAFWEPKETKRITVPEFDKTLFNIIPFLDHGQFMPIDYMGDDYSFAQAARTSYGKGTKTISDDNKLVDSLIRDLHTSPIEMAELSFMTRAPIFTDPRQFGRHRTLDNDGFMGYVPTGNLFYFPDDSQFKHQDKLNRQGRGKEMDEPEKKIAKELIKQSLEEELKVAQELEDLGVPESFIRDIKGVNFYTKRWRTGDAHNLQHMLGLRGDDHAQYEIRVLAEIIAKAHKMHTPNAYESFLMHQKNAMRLSSKEIDWMIERKMLNENIDPENLDLYKNVPGFTIKDGIALGREGKGAQEKLKKLLGKK